MNSYLTPIGIRLSNLSLLIFLSGVLGAQCPGDVSWTMDPSPVNGQYQAGQTVNICAEINDFNMTGFLLLGIVLDFPEAWDLSTVQVNTAPVACEENTGEWLYLEDILLPEIMAPGTGFFYDYYGANGDGDPLNDWGDGCGDASGNWSFCISVTLQSCGGSGNIVDDADITPSITLMNDNVIYDNPWAPPCNFTEHAFTESLTLNCCTAQSGGSPGILPICDYPIPLILELIPPYGTGGAWTDPSGSSFIGTFFPGENEPGDYTYTVAGTDGCMNSTTITLAYLNWGELQYSLYCQIEPVALSDLLTGVVLPSGGIWYNPNGYEVTNGIVDPSVDVSGVYTYVFENENLYYDSQFRSDLCG